MRSAEPERPKTLRALSAQVLKNPICEEDPVHQVMPLRLISRFTRAESAVLRLVGPARS